MLQEAVFFCFFLDNGNSDVSGDVAKVHADFDPDIALLSPVLTPGVSDDPDLEVVLFHVANDLDAVVDLHAAGLEDATVVVLPGSSIDTDADGTVVADVVEHGGLLLGGLLRNVFPVRDLGGNKIRVESAGAVFSGVGIVLLGFLTAGLDHIFVGGFGVASVATTIVGVTIDDLLGTQDDLRVSSLDPGRFDGFSGGESPARSALFLVLDGGDDSSGLAPITRGGGSLGGRIEFEHAAFRREVSRDVFEEGGLEFFGGQIHELGDSEDVAVLHLVHLVDEAKVVMENPDAVVALLNRLIGLGKFGLEGDEFL